MSGLEDPEAAIIALFRVVNRYVGKLAADARRIPRLSDASDPQHASRDRDDADALGMPPSPGTQLPGRRARSMPHRRTRVAWISSVSPDDREHFGTCFDNWSLNLLAPIRLR